MIQDLHAHTNYSFDSPDEPKKVIETAIAGGITMLGICDHNYGVGLARRELCYNRGTDLSVDYDRTLRHYYEHITLLKEKYEKKIKIMRGIEIATAIGKHNFFISSNPDLPCQIASGMQQSFGLCRAGIMAEADADRSGFQCASAFVGQRRTV